MPKPRKCKECGTKFEPGNSFQKVCTPACGIRWATKNPQFTQRANKAIEKAQRSARTKERKAARDKLKTRSEWLKHAKKWFHAWIRLRDISAGYNCICCDQPFEPNKPGGSVDAGHFRSVGSAKHMEFVEDNVHAQRKGCNRAGQNRYEAYKAGLIKRIGLERVEALEADQAPRKYTIDDFKELMQTYKQKIKELQAKLYTS